MAPYYLGLDPSKDGLSVELEYLLSATPHVLEGQQLRGSLKQAF